MWLCLLCQFKEYFTFLNIQLFYTDWSIFREASRGSQFRRRHFWTIQLWGSFKCLCFSGVKQSRSGSWSFAQFLVPLQMQSQYPFSSLTRNFILLLEKIFLQKFADAQKNSMKTFSVDEVVCSNFVAIKFGVKTLFHRNASCTGNFHGNYCRFLSVKP